MVQLSAGPCGGAVSVGVAPAPHLRVEVVEDLDCWALRMLVQRGGDGAGVSAYLGLLRLRQHSPWKPPDLASEEVEPLCAMHDVGCGFTQVESSCSKKACEGGEDLLFEDRPRRGDDHQVVRVPHETDACVRSCCPGWTLGVPLRIFSIAEAFHAIQGHVREQG